MKSGITYEQGVSLIYNSSD